MALCDMELRKNISQAMMREITRPVGGRVSTQVWCIISWKMKSHPGEVPNTFLQFSQTFTLFTILRTELN